MTAAAERFEAARPRLLRLAYSQLGEIAAAEDVVQDAWLRLEWAGPDTIEDLDAWLTTVVARLALDVLRSARARREAYVGPWLPEPVSTEPGPEDRVTLDESVGFALLAVLERLSPAERTAFVLHDVFSLSFAEVAEVVGRTPAACRQLAARARRHVDEGRPRFPAPPEQHRAVVEAFGAALAAGDLEAVVRLLDPDVVWTADGGGVVIAARKPVRGARRVARAWLALSRKGGGSAIALAELNGRTGILVDTADGTRSAIAFAVDGARITRIDVVRNPAKLGHVAPVGAPNMR